MDGERNLLFAVLEDAIKCYLDYDSAERSLTKRVDFAEANQWINSSSEGSPFTFVNICYALGINPERLRGGLKRQRAGTRNLKPSAAADRAATSMSQVATSMSQMKMGSESASSSSFAAAAGR
ncbi:MAG TPA: hypothetical protein VIX59_09775 [Candidatus Binataceae bacterium]